MAREIPVAHEEPANMLRVEFSNEGTAPPPATAAERIRLAAGKQAYSQMIHRLNDYVLDLERRGDSLAALADTQKATIESLQAENQRLQILLSRANGDISELKDELERKRGPKPMESDDGRFVKCGNSIWPKPAQVVDYQQRRATLGGEDD